MSEFIVYRSDGRLGPTFNQAAAILEAHEDLLIKDKLEMRGDRGMFVIETTEQVARDLQKELPDWLIGPNNKRRRPF